MTVAEMLDKVQYVTDTEGTRRAVIIELAIWEELLERLEDLEDEAEMVRAKQEKDELIPWEQVQAEYRAAHPDTDV